MRVNIQAAGKFTAYHAARAAYARGTLNRLVTGRRRRDEAGVPFDLRRHIAWPSYLFYAMATAPVLANRSVASRIADEAFDRSAARRSEPVDVLHGFLAYSLHSLRAYRRLGAKILVDTGAAHIGVERELLQEEFNRFGEPQSPMDDAWVRKQEVEYEEADIVVVPSMFVRDSLVSRGIPVTKIEIVRHGIDLQRFAYQPQTVTDGPLRLVSGGAISFEKGVPYLLEACEELEGRVTLPLIGKVFPEMRRMLGQTKAKFTHIPHVPNAELASVLANHDAFVLASVQYGSAMAVTEAMAAGRPVIVSKSNGAQEFVNENAGVVVPSRSASALVEAVEHLLVERQRLPEMGAAARDAVKDQTWQKYGNELAGVYERLSSSG